MKEYIQMSIAGILLGLSYIPTDPKLNCLFAWLAIVYLCFIIKKNTSLLSWFCFGFTLTATRFYWAAYIFQKYSEANSFSSALFALAVWSLAAIQYLLLGWVISEQRRRKWSREDSGLNTERRRSGGGGFNLIFTDLLRYVFKPESSLLLTWPLLEAVFPQFIPNSLGSTQIYFTHLAQLADIGGPILISFTMLCWASLIVNLSFRNLSILAAWLGLVFAYGQFRINEIEDLSKKAPKISLGVVQPNLDSDHDFTAEQLPERMQKLWMLSGGLFQEKIDLLIWPENAVGYTYKDTATEIERNNSEDPFPALHLPLLFGAQTQATEDALYNSAYIMQTDGRLSSRYNKQKLFPFSETIPFSRTFPFLKKFFKPSANVMETGRQSAMQFNQIELATVICFEDLWSQIYRSLLKDNKAQILITLANDGWFANSRAAYQHKMLASWRAIEYRRYLLRSTNNGLTELISPTGMVISSISEKKEGTLYAKDTPALRHNSPYRVLIENLDIF